MVAIPMSATKMMSGLSFVKVLDRALNLLSQPRMFWNFIFNDAWMPADYFGLIQQLYKLGFLQVGQGIWKLYSSIE